MATFLMISRHSPENCGMFNEKARKVVFEAMAKLEGLSKKHGVKMVGSWIVPTEHLSFMVFEAPSLEAFQNFGMEPEILALREYGTSEIKLVTTLEEAMKMLQQAK